MRIGLLTDSLASLPLDAVLDLCSAQGVTDVELGCGGWSPAPHVDLELLAGSERARRELLGRLDARGVAISALNCSGNPLDPRADGREDDRVTRRTIRVAGLLGVERVVLMSGLPPAPGDSTPNWVTVSWPRELRDVLEGQWSVAIAYWRDLAREAGAAGVRLCVELHGYQLVHNVPTLLRLRDEVGPTVGANLDPSHLLWMGADPIAAVEALGPAVYHVHAKDTRLEPAAALRGRLETLPDERADERAWNFATLGDGEDDTFWRTFVRALADAGYDDVLSVELEDARRDPLDGVLASIALLRRVLAPEEAAA